MHPFLKKVWVQRLLGGLTASYLSFVNKTSRWRMEGQAPMDQFLAGKKAVIVVFWHRDMILAPFAWRRGIPFRMLISGHSDGELIARVVGHLGIDTISGSSSHVQGTRALKGMLKALESGVSVGITPDGPRGPRGVLKEGLGRGVADGGALQSKGALLQ